MNNINNKLKKIEDIKQVLKRSKEESVQALKSRWMCYLIAYVICYFIQLFGDKVKSPRPYFPIKVMALAMSVVIGNALYHKATISREEAFTQGFKSTVISFLIFCIAAILIKLVKFIFGFDMYEYIG